MTNPPRESQTRVALVTGGSRGIGRAVVEALLADGWRVFFCGISADGLALAERELRKTFGDSVAGRICDVRDEEDVRALVRWTVEEGGRLDCLVNNAGLGFFAPIDEMSGDDWRRVIETNLSGAFYCLREAALVMKGQGSGFIFNIASLASKNPFAAGAVYNASKFGLLGMSEAAMLDLRHHGIRVAAIMPGSVDTDFSHPKPGEDRSWRLAPEDVARAVLDLLRYPDRALPSRIELRPSRPPKG